MNQQHIATKDVTIIDVAREAGVSYSTVSRVVNNKQNVRPEKRERVLQAMTRLGYVVNQQARSLAGGRSNVIGLLVRDLATGYAGEIIRGIDAELSQAQYDLMLYTTHHRRTKEVVHVTSITRGLADGLLVVLPTDPSAYVTTLRQRNFPYVLIDHPGLTSNDLTVQAANEKGAYEATKYLIEIGHRHIGFITGDLNLRSGMERLTGYKKALGEYGLPENVALICEGDYFQTRGYECTKQLLHLPNRPTAIFASNDSAAFGVMEAVREEGLRIPEDISIVGFDDIPQACQVHPQLTTVRQPLEEMGRTATRMLLKKLQNPEQEVESKLLETKLVVRSSSQAVTATV